MFFLLNIRLHLYGGLGWWFWKSAKSEFYIIYIIEYEFVFAFYCVILKAIYFDLLDFISILDLSTC